MKRLAIVLLPVALMGLSSCHHASSSNAITCTSSTSTSSATSTETCTDPSTGISITISPATISLNVNSVQIFSVTLSGGTNSSFNLEVSGVPHGNGTVGIIDSSGRYTAPVAVPTTMNPVMITATSVEDANLTATATVTITPAPVLTITSPAPPIKVTSGASPANAVTFVASESGGQTGDSIYWCVTPVVGGHPQPAIFGGDSEHGTISTNGATGNGTYTPPLTPPVGQEVMVTAAISPAGEQLTDCQLSAVSVPVMISGYSTSSLQGQFAFSLSGQTTTGNRFFRAGSFHADGAGNLSNVMETINGASGVTSGTFDGTFTIAADGRGTLTFNDGLGPAPSNASNFDFVLLDGTHLQIIGFDATGIASGEATGQNLSTFSGDPLSALTGTYVFDFSGASGANSISEIGEFTADGNGNITGGSIDISGGSANPYQITASTYTVNSNGSGTLALATNDPTFPTLNFAFYAVSKGSAKFVGTTQAVGGATMEQQLLASGTSFDKTHLNGNYAFLLTNSGATYASAGSFSADGQGNITGGVLDENSNGTPNSDVPLSSTTYQINSTGRGTILPTGGRTYVFYLGPTGAAVFQETDAAHASDGVFALQQSSSFAVAQIAGNYALATSGLSGVAPETLTGEMTTDGAGNVSSGTADVNTNGATTAGVGITGSYVAGTSTSERGTLTLNLTNPLDQIRSFAVYVVSSVSSSPPVSSSQIFILEIDSNGPSHLAAGQLLLRF